MDDKILNTIICGANEDILPTFEVDSVDTVITDPPYGLSFMGKRWDYEVPSVETWEMILRVLKPGGTLLCFAGSRTQHRMACNVEDAGFILKDCIMWLYGSGFPKAKDISKALDKLAGAEREVVGEYKMPTDSDAGNAGKATIDRGDGGSFTAGQNVMITAPATAEAKLWDGWKSHGLKPAYEPILVAMKPNDGSYANNALTHRVAGLNIDAGRIAFKSEEDKADVFAKATKNHEAYPDWDFQVGENQQGNRATPPDDKGRYPANVILDEQAAAMLDEQSGEMSPSVRNFPIDAGGTGNTLTFKHTEGEERGFSDSGGASRFFYCAKASKSERNDGCEDLAERQTNKMGSFGDQSKFDCPDGANRVGDKGSSIQQNHHPTVKPLALMEYLCRLTSTPTGGIVLDPFAGSGTTLLAAYNTGRDYIGIERDPEYIKIIEARLAGARAKLGLFNS